MTWHTPRTWRPGDVARNLTARVLNSELRDNLQYLYNRLIVGAGDATGGVWVNVSGGIGFLNSWADQGGTTAPAQYRIDAGWVSLRGSITGGTTGTSVGTAFTLPTGYRPQYDQTFCAASGLTGNGHIFVRPSGNVVIIDNPGGTYIDLATVRFTIP